MPAPDSIQISFADYIESCLARISFSYNVVKNIIPNGNSILTKIIDRFPDFNKRIVGSNSFFDVYFTHLFPIPIKENKNDVIKQNKKPNSKAHLVENFQLDRFPKECKGITKWYQGEDDETYASALHYLYLFTTVP